jgi:mannose-6-phosphate isomerase-like protein (cupin superfamily)
MTKPIKEYYFKEGCFIEEWLNSPDYPDMSVARVRVEPGVTTRLHKLANTAERYLIISGQGQVTVGDQSWSVTEKDIVSIGQDIPQKIANTGTDNLVFIAICTPRFSEENYQDLEH